MRRLLSLVLGWICVACLAVAVVSVAIGDIAGAIPPGLIAFVALAASGWLTPRSHLPGPTTTPTDRQAVDAAAKAKAKAKAKRQADARRRREEEEIIAEMDRRNNDF